MSCIALCDICFVLATYVFASVLILSTVRRSHIGDLSAVLLTVPCICV